MNKNERVGAGGGAEGVWNDRGAGNLRARRQAGKGEMRKERSEGGHRRKRDGGFVRSRFPYGGRCAGRAAPSAAPRPGHAAPAPSSSADDSTAPGAASAPAG